LGVVHPCILEERDKPVVQLARTKYARNFDTSHRRRHAMSSLSAKLRERADELGVSLDRLTVMSMSLIPTGTTHRPIAATAHGSSNRCENVAYQTELAQFTFAAFTTPSSHLGVSSDPIMASLIETIKRATFHDE